MPSTFVNRWGVYPLWLLLTLTVWFRTIIPIDETRYVSVAWEMWLRDDFLVPYLNGQPYSHKPPLLIWLIQAGWAVFGVNDIWPRLVGPLMALLNLVLVRKLAATLWPDAPGAALLAPWLLVATLLWTLFASSLMFDTLLTNCVLLGMFGMTYFANGQTRRGWLLLATAIALGILAKGPVIFLHLLPTALLMPLWLTASDNRPGYKQWTGYLSLASLLGVAMALCWALPAAIQGGEKYASAILWHQTADRTVGTQIHQRGFHWYFLFILAFLLPWIAWPRFWQNLRLATIKADQGLRFCGIWFAATFLIFSLLPSKQVHYLLPILPAFALLSARLFCLHSPKRKLLAELTPSLCIGLIGLLLAILPYLPNAELYWTQALTPAWGLSVLSIAFFLAAWTIYRESLSIPALASTMIVGVFIGFFFFFRYAGPAYDLRPAAALLKDFNQRDIPCAFVHDYQGQLHFLGRLTAPLQVIPAYQVGQWALQHPQGYLISLESKSDQLSAYQQLHREHWLIFRSALQQKIIDTFNPEAGRYWWVFRNALCSRCEAGLKSASSLLQ